MNRAPIDTTPAYWLGYADGLRAVREASATLPDLCHHTHYDIYVNGQYVESAGHGLHLAGLRKAATMKRAALYARVSPLPAVHKTRAHTLAIAIENTARESVSVSVHLNSFSWTRRTECGRKAGA